MYIEGISSTKSLSSIHHDLKDISVCYIRLRLKQQFEFKYLKHFLSGIWHTSHFHILKITYAAQILPCLAHATRMWQPPTWGTRDEQY